MKKEKEKATEKEGEKEKEKAVGRMQRGPAAKAQEWESLEEMWEPWRV